MMSFETGRNNFGLWVAIRCLWEWLERLVVTANEIVVGIA